ncbi:ABC transporter substrate-binding protein [Aliidongia dinghuensis]|uniref:ABC transporter substrate-binding protein n=1 Tax=Aliidongia dinghuensis TaxID=1867774 RepID=A0A8J2YXI1_9PROT|nr:ABC transporter substrate-binding protein [Aliidongia dinghuensis]GGF28809.1 ABC transporter substrate-binding protein [Aliidongia dinghuensis]
MKASYALPVLALLVASTAPAAELPAAIKAKGEIVFANVPNYPPFEFKDPATDKLSGVDIELGEAIAAKLGVKAKWQESAFAEMISALSTGRVDLIMSGMTDLASRQDQVTFVDYVKSGPQFYTTAEHAAEFKDMVALCGKKVGTSRRTSFPTEIAAWSDAHCKPAGKPAIEVVGTEGSADARTQLRQGRVDAAMQGNETIPYMMSQEPGAYAPIGQAIAAQFTGIGIAKADKPLQDAVAAALDQVITDGTYQKILAKWQLGDIAVAKATINAGK